ncbi:MAG TPA: S8 family serine peptidase [Chryseolinea sp.]|nr:S8 family serine peptidase [Chryseolinea sp.]
MRCVLLVALPVIACCGLYAQAQPPFQKIKTQQINLRDQQDQPRVLQFDPANFKKGPHVSDTARVIIKLQSASSQRIGVSAASGVDSQHRLFYDDLAKLTAESAGRLTNEIQTVVHYEYRAAFNGFALTTSTRIVERIKNLPYVTAVLEDKLCKVSSEESNTVIRAQQARQSFGTTGKNIKIGIIDTGIDYTHPDLGQGFGPGFKVVGGYDFVNNDPDPMDDFGHGTHVAGIAAANGATYKGVAPDAQLVAYKVLGSDGSGYDSWILAAIERALDPDQNPATDDALDIVNMSVGRMPDASEPLSEAVNSAVAKGVVFCIAAGNSGLYFGIGTPGIAANAITVGATDNDLNTAFFSSKGPTEDLRLKPEVAAPGVAVTSTVLSHGYQSMDGTSMASPHVAGAVALILEKHPDFTPAMVKCLLMTTAQTSPSSSSSWEQGAGVIDVFKALSISFMISSGFLNFGLADAASINKTQSFSIRNNSAVTQSFNLTSEGELNSSPFALMISPSQLTLQPGAEQLITVTLTSSVAVALQNFPDTYTGRIYVSNGQTIAKIESVIMNPQHTDISYEGQLPDKFIVLGVEGSTYWVPYVPRPDQTSMRLYLPAATYDIVSFYDNALRILITEGIDTQQNLTITLRKADVKNQIIFKPLDENGGAIDVSNNAFGTAVFTGNNRNIVTMFTSFVDTMYFSDTEHYRIEFGYNNLVNGKYYDISAGTGWGISSGSIYSNSPNTFSKITFKNPSVQIGESQMTTSFINFGVPSVFSTTWNLYPFELPASFDFYQTQRSPTSAYLGIFFSFAPAPQKSGYTWETYNIRAEEGDQISFYLHADRKQLTVNKKRLVYPFGKTIPSFNMTPGHSDTNISYETFMGRGAFNHAFGERESGTTAYHLHQNGVTIKKGLILQSMHHETDCYFPTASTSPGQYNLDFEYRDFQTAGKFAIAKLSTTFDTNNTDKNPPHLKSIRLISNEEDTNELQTSIGAKLLLTVLDGCETCYQSGIKTPIVNIKKEDAAGWSALTIESVSADEYKADLPALEPGYYVVQIKSEDNAGNNFIYEVTPAFYVGEEPQRTPYTTVNLISPRNNSHNAGTTPLFKWTSVNANNYTLQISDDLTFENSIERTADQNEFLLESPLIENKVYFWRVKPNGSNTSGAWSTIFRFESKSLPAVQLISPTNGGEVDYLNASFEWSLVEGAGGYQLEVSADENFSMVVFSYRMFGTEVATSLFPGRQYYWRVKAFFFSGWFEEESVSAVRTFNTKSIPPPTLLFPSDNSTDVALQTNFWWSGEAPSYFFELSKNEDFTDVIHSFTVNNNSIEINTLEPSTDYFWRVKGNVSDTYGVWSSIFRFKSKSFPAVQLISPANGGETDYRNALFEWYLVEGALGYQLEISADENFSTLEFSARISRTRVSTPLFPGRHYYWRVKAFFFSGWSEEESVSVVGIFNTKHIPPPTLLFPSDNSTDVELQTNFWWSGESATSYLFELSNNEDFTDVIHSFTVNNNSVVINTLEPSTDYFWRVKANASNTSGVWSSTFRFKSIDAVTSIESVESTLNYSVPNPFNTYVEIEVENSMSQDAVINIVDQLGRVVKQLHVEQKTGNNRVNWDGTDDHGDVVASGVYFAFILRPGQVPAVIRMMRVSH